MVYLSDKCEWFQMNKLSDFFEHDEIFIACGPEKLKKLADEDLAYISE